MIESEIFFEPYYQVNIYKFFILSQYMESFFYDSF
jgi:hypothetical protein